MRAFGIKKYKAPVAEMQVPEPTVRPGDVLVEVAAAGLNHLDERIRSGGMKSSLKYTPPMVLGHDVAGRVLQVGAGVTGFAVSDRVCSRVRDFRIGTFAERIAVPADDLAQAPRGLSDAETASLPLVALTAWQALVVRGGVGSGAKVLIHGGAGGVGSIAIQLAKHLGAWVATTASTRDAEWLRELGADQVIDYRNEDFTTELTGYDFVLDHLGAESVLRSLTVLRPGGKVVGIAGPPTPELAHELGLSGFVAWVLGLVSGKVRRAAAKRGVSYEFLMMRASGEQLAGITRLVDEGAIRPIVASTYPFEETPKAFADLGKKGGKFVVLGPGKG